MPRRSDHEADRNFRELERGSETVRELLEGPLKLFELNDADDYRRYAEERNSAKEEDRTRIKDKI